jgi:hypothetical protein
LIEVAIVTKSLIIPELRRVLKPPFAWIDRRFLLNGFLAALSHQENLLYFFLILVADRDGLSFYSYDKICQLLQLDVDDYIQARNGLIEKQLIAYDGHQFQVLALPERQQSSPTLIRPTPKRVNDVQSLADIFARLAQQPQQ